MEVVKDNLNALSRVIDSFRLALPISFLELLEVYSVKGSRVRPTLRNAL